jgi:hypothetical protein
MLSFHAEAPRNLGRETFIIAAITWSLGTLPVERIGISANSRIYILHTYADRIQCINKSASSQILYIAMFL